MMSSSRATYSPTLSPLSMGHMLNSASNMRDSPQFAKKVTNPCRWTSTILIESSQKGGGMRQWIVSAAVVLIATSFGFAQAPEPTRVIVAPFTEVNEQQQADWISRAIQQSVADE